ncbi:hypothetical protein PROFUN_12542 [Planoprotostelium fungivorum]|uniref:DUF7886 domain-containing protein n=1 Tax=Planoprotostelium fungivorum TaxID=1890364 RepID=A0A2P6N763_9EUKA|nr:hypothetical protein PROFUN_12542 [Planoprotostelium fungivorum]
MATIAPKSPNLSSPAAGPHKKSLSPFLSDLVLFGCLQCFVHFDTRSRSKEELIVTIKSPRGSEEAVPLLQRLRSPTKPVPPPFSTPNDSSVPGSPKLLRASFTANTTAPASPKPLRSSFNRLQPPNISIHGDINAGRVQRLRAPVMQTQNTWDEYCDHHLTSEQQTKDAVLLVAAYARYGHPHVWLRSESKEDNEQPLELSTIKRWSTEGIRVWQVLEELLRVSKETNVVNPFQIDFRKLRQVPDLERSVLTASLLRMLRKIYQQKPNYHVERL